MGIRHQSLGRYKTRQPQTLRTKEARGNRNGRDRR